MPFSTLMFLQPSPPRLTRRSKLDNLILLLLRALALTLIALAFCRPFIRLTAMNLFANKEGRRVAILIDTSASMQRSGLWNRVKEEASGLLKELSNDDQAALLTFNDSVTVEVPFADKPTAADLAGSKTLIEKKLSKLSATWRTTNLGEALTMACGLLQDNKALDKTTNQTRLQVVVISDMQSGANLNALQSFEWPKEVKVSLRQVIADPAGNASVTVLRDSAESDVDDEKVVRVRVANDGESENEEFTIGWNLKAPEAKPNNLLDGELNIDSSAELADERTIQVPAGESRVIKMKPAVDQQPFAIELRGDPADFDNRFFLEPSSDQIRSIAFLGNSDRSESGLFYYLSEVFSSLDFLKAEVKMLESDVDLSLTNPQLLVVAGDEIGNSEKRLRSFVKDGGQILLVLSSVKMEQIYRSLLDNSKVKVGEAKLKDFALLGEIDFKDQLFQPFADPKYSDFTRLKFWRHRTIDIPVELEPRVVAKFDNGNPAIIRHLIGKGELVVLATGWNPEDSQLAVSTKFVPLMIGVLNEIRAAGSQKRYVVGRPIEFSAQDEIVSVKDPSGNVFSLTRSEKENAASNSPLRFTPNETGVYRTVDASNEFAFAVNIDPQESKVTPLDQSALEKFGMVLGLQPTRQEMIEEERQMKNAELEKSQRGWFLLIIAAMLVLTLETIVAGWFARKQSIAESN